MRFLLLAATLALACSSPDGGRTKAAGSGPLAVEAVRYRHPVGQRRSVSDAITELSPRAATPNATLADYNELAGLYLKRAVAEGSAEDFAAAEAMAAKSLAINPTGNPATLIPAKVANARHEFLTAIEIAKAEVATHPSAPAYGVLATAYLALGDLVEAAHTADAAVRLQAGTGTYLLRALVLDKAGRDAEAAWDFEHAVAVEEAGDADEAARLRALWGRSLIRANRPADAARVIAEALRIVPEHPLALAQRGELLLRTGKLPEARAAFEQAFALSRQVRYLIDLARAQELSGDLTAATETRTTVEKLVRADLAASHSTGHRLELVEVLLDRGGAGPTKEALAMAQEEVVARPSDATRFQLARAQLATGDRKGAQVHVAAILAMGVRDARVYELAARVEDGPRAALYRTEADRWDPGGSKWRSLGLAK